MTAAKYKRLHENIVVILMKTLRSSLLVLINTCNAYAAVKDYFTKGSTQIPTAQILACGSGEEVCQVYSLVYYFLRALAELSTEPSSSVPLSMVVEWLKDSTRCPSQQKILTSEDTQRVEEITLSPNRQALDKLHAGLPTPEQALISFPELAHHLEETQQTRGSWCSGHVAKAMADLKERSPQGLIEMEERLLHEGDLIGHAICAERLADSELLAEEKRQRYAYRALRARFNKATDESRDESPLITFIRGRLCPTMPLGLALAWGGLLRLSASSSTLCSVGPDESSEAAVLANISCAPGFTVRKWGGADEERSRPPELLVLHITSHHIQYCKPSPQPQLQPMLRLPSQNAPEIGEVHHLARYIV
eukprot:TRINITY_DN11726_c0_g1_i1.p1 TRINITY_DN11726_c0_g1~~TRINITY_DN11726_c0_g1_i1.p1  ORF type:complete len:364 (+),score=53.42 TRINITY_DN11726_c0_g1_i1:808-1899(+)